MDNSTIGLIVFIASIFVARYINERGLKKLDEKQASRLLKGFSRYRIFSLVGVGAIVLVYFIVSYNYPDSAYAAPPVFMGVMVVYLLTNSVIAFRKLKQLELPDEYINYFLLGTLIQYGGIFALFGTASVAR